VVKVVGHLRVQLLGRLLGPSGTSSLSGRLLGRLSRRIGALRVGTMLDGRSRLWLSLGLADALTQRLRLGDEVRICDDNLNLVRVSICLSTTTRNVFGVEEEGLP
jgi:hypothetical protein